MNRYSLSKRIFAALLVLLVVIPDYVQAFCGFYVAKADASLFNKSSQVILVRDGNKTAITMYSDFQGDVKDFAMVVPVPTVLKRDQISTLSKDIFAAFDGYSGPRLVDYYDHNPCQQLYSYDSMTLAGSAAVDDNFAEAEKATTGKLGVKIEANYKVGEYDILILSAEESGGLETWLKINGYKIPEGAKEVLTPYIQNNMKFFVVKVDLEALAKSGSKELNPIQIRFESPKFMLPIRLGMANASGDQDLIIYTLTRNGRVESTNYRTAKMPTDKKIPEFVAKKFGPFYSDVYKKAWGREGKASVMLEYAWDISGTQSVKCDPCPTPPLSYADLHAAGCDWLQGDSWGGGTYVGPVFFTRLHARYNRVLYPQDLAFQETPNRENYQARYVITHPAQGAMDCEGAGKYLEEVIYRRREELNNLAYLTGWEIGKYNSYVAEYEMKYKNVTGMDFMPIGGIGSGPDGGPGDNMKYYFVLGLAAVAALVLSLRRKPAITTTN